MVRLSLRPTERFGGEGARDRVASPAKMNKTNKLRMKGSKEESKVENIQANENIGFGIRVQKMDEFGLHQQSAEVEELED